MEEMLYTPRILALIACARDMSMKEMAGFISLVWEYEKEYLFPDHRFSKKKLQLDVMNEVNYMQDKDSFDREFALINIDLKSIGSELEYYPEDEEEDWTLFFISLRLRMIFLDSQDYVRMKLRTMIGYYGYKRRTVELTAYLKDCLMFYHIKTYTRGENPCDIREIALDDMITFRVLGNIREYISPKEEHKEKMQDDNAGKFRLKGMQEDDMPMVHVGSKVITVSLHGLERHIVLTPGKMKEKNVKVLLGGRGFMVSLTDGDIWEL